MFKWLGRRRRREQEIEDELAYHRAMLIEDAMEEGETQPNGGAYASRRLGNGTQIKEATRAVWIWTWLETLLLDVRYGLRQLRKGPVLVGVAVFSLALGIGANSAIFSVMDAVLRKSLPVRDPARLVLFYDGAVTGGYNGDDLWTESFSYPFWETIRNGVAAFEEICAFRQGNDRVVLRIANASGSDNREQAMVHLVSGNYFHVLGVSPAVGRMLRVEDDRIAAPGMAVMSYPMWRDRFQLDAAIVGHTVSLNGTPFTVAGVAPPEFFGERVQSPPDFWVPLSREPEMVQDEPWFARRDEYWLNMMGRLKPGRTIADAESEVTLRLHEYFAASIGSKLSREKKHELATARAHLMPGGAGISGLRIRYSKPLRVLMAAVVMILLIACANVAILLLARASARRQEFSSRLALGASRARVARQVLVESVLLAVIAGLVGVAFAWWGVKGLVLLFPMNSVTKVQPDPAVLFFTASVAVGAGILFGVWPALRCSQVDLRAGTAVRAVEFGNRGFGGSRVLIAGQVMLSLILLVGTGLLVHSLLELERQNIGFDRHHILLVRTDPRLADYKPAQLLPLYQQLDQRLNTLPGVVSATIARFTPESGSVSSNNFSLEGYTPPRGKKMELFTVEVAPGFTETLRMPLLLGRSIERSDLPMSKPVVVVNETFVRTYLPHVNPIGRRLAIGAHFKAPGVEIVGVTADAKYYGVRDLAKPMAYFSAWQGQGYTPYIGEIIVSTIGEPFTALPAVRKALQSVDNRLAILDVRTLEEQVDSSFGQHRAVSELAGLFSGLALLLAAVGIYGSNAYMVARRSSEMGIRMALGAQRADVLWMTFREALLVVAAGIGIGLPAAFLASRVIRSFLFGITPWDAWALAGATLLIAVAGLLAGYLPARRATKIDPMRALRYE